MNCRLNMCDGGLSRGEVAHILQNCPGLFSKDAAWPLGLGEFRWIQIMNTHVAVESQGWGGCFFRAMEKFWMEDSTQDE